MAFDYTKFMAAQKPIAMKVTEVTPHEKRAGYLKVSGILEDGSETFFVASEEELKALPADSSNTILNLTGFCVLKKNKINKHYVERVKPLPAISGSSGFENPFK